VSALEFVGLLIQIIGTGIAGEALLDDWRQHGQGRPLIPAWPKFLRRIRRLWPWRRNAQVLSGTARSSVTVTGTATGHASPFVAEDAPLEEQVPWLRERLEVLKGEVGELTEVLAQTQGNLSRQIMNVSAEAQEADTSLRAKLTEVATGRVRQEMAGLGLVVVGTFVSAWG
jgi:hypothetical protein